MKSLNWCRTALRFFIIIAVPLTLSIQNSSAKSCAVFYPRPQTARIADIYLKRGRFDLAIKFYKKFGEFQNAKRAALMQLATKYESSSKIQFAIWIWRHLGNHERADSIETHLESLMLSAPLVYIRDLPDGKNGRTRLYEIQGTPFQVVVKGTESYNEDPNMEIFAFRFDRLLELDLVPITVSRIVDNEKGSVQIFTPGLRGDQYIMRKYGINALDFDRRIHLDNLGHDDFTELREHLESLGKRTHFLGFVLGTFDRHPLNLIIDPELERIVPDDLYLGRALFDNAGADPERPFDPQTTKSILVAGTRRNGITRTLEQIVPGKRVLEKLKTVSFRDLEIIGSSLISEPAIQGVWNRLRYFQIRAPVTSSEHP